MAECCDHTLPAPVAPVASRGAPRVPARGVTVEALYDVHADTVYRSLRRLGVPPPLLADALQDVFVVVHRRLGDAPVEAGHLRGWLFAIAVRVAANHRRALRRRWWERAGRGDGPELEQLASASPDDPLERLEHRQQVARFYALLECLDDDKRAVFVLAELEELSTPEIARVLGVNVNTVQARLRAARQRFQQALDRARAAGRRSVG